MFIRSMTVSGTVSGDGPNVPRVGRPIPRLQDFAYDSSDKIKDRGFIRADYVEVLFDQHQRSTNPGHSGPLRDLMPLEYWFRSHVDGRAKITEEQVV